MKMDKNSKSLEYYDEKYVSEQNNVAIDNIPTYNKVFQPHATKEMTILDFGCGAGILLSVLNGKYKIGVDVNKNALEKAKKNGINEVHTNLDNIKPKSIDLIVSNSALEHVPNPHQVLSRLYELLKPEGKILFRVPHETLGWDYKSGDWNYHLFTWSPMAIGNLFNDVGFSDIEVRIEKGIRPPLFRILRKINLEKIIGYLYRIFRIILDELRILRIGVDGYSIVSAKK
tara:strand:- start:663 stop:1349 length:687 start_codon:yes stop_codon:yes gene_type:complete